MSLCAQSCQAFCDPVDCSLPDSLSGGFSRLEYWNGLPFPSPADLSDPGIETVSPVSPALQADSLLAEPLGKPDLLPINYRPLLLIMTPS